MKNILLLKKFFLSKNIDYFFGVPDSVLKNLFEYIDKDKKIKNIIAANEGNALALAAGYQMASNKVPVVYLQNSGLGNLINPALSLTSKKLHDIPIIYLIGWRGSPDSKDEPQHLETGKITLDILKLMNIDYFVVDEDSKKTELNLSKASKYYSKNKNSFAIVVKKNAFKNSNNFSNKIIHKKFTRRLALENIYKIMSKKFLFVVNTGYAGREFYEVSESVNTNEIKYFLNVGAMGHTSSIAMGLLLGNKNENIICIDGDGSLIMHMGALPVIGLQNESKNLVHILLNNGVHDSVGAQPNSSNQINYRNLSKSLGYKKYIYCKSENSLKKTLNKVYKAFVGPIFIEVVIHSEGELIGLKRPTAKPKDSKLLFMNNFKRISYKKN